MKRKSSNFLFFITPFLPHSSHGFTFLNGGAGSYCPNSCQQQLQLQQQITSQTQHRHCNNGHTTFNTILNNGGGTCYRKSKRSYQTLYSSFYSDFEDFENDEDDDDDDDDDDDEYIDLDEKAFANFKAKMGAGLSESSELFENEADDEDEEEDDDDLISLEDSESNSFSSVDELISFATSSSNTSSQISSDGTDTNQVVADWAKEIDIDQFSQTLKGGVVLLANPEKFCADLSMPGNSSGNQPSPALLAKFGLTIPPPKELGADRRADLLPVLVMTERNPLRGCQALLMNRRTGYMIGDLEQNQQLDDDDDDDGDNNNNDDDDDDENQVSNLPPQLGAFMIQPLWFGGTSPGEQSGLKSSPSKGLEMLHICPAVENATKLTEDGLYWGGDPGQAQDAMSDPTLERVVTGFDFKFYVQSTRWLPLQLEKEIKDGTWIMASVSKEVLFKSRDRLGAKRAKPLWTEIMELMGGKHKDMRDRLYDGEE
jgi:hypothetical protein